MSDIREEIRILINRVQFDPSIKAELESAIRADTRNGASIATIIDNPNLSNDEKAAELSAFAMTLVGPNGIGGIAAAIAIGVIIGLLL